MSHPIAMDDKNTLMETFFTAIEQQLPMVFDRATASKCTEGILSPKILSNADAAGTGPTVKMKVGKKIVYERTAFINWLKTKIK